METTHFLQQQAAQGDTDALFRLDYRIAYGKNRAHPTNWADALALWIQAAESDHVRAMFYVGVCYDEGRGVSQDVSEALRRFGFGFARRVPFCRFSFAARTGAASILWRMC